jgi:hypothetical protein
MGQIAPSSTLAEDSTIIVALPDGTYDMYYYFFCHGTNIIGVVFDNRKGETAKRAWHSVCNSIGINERNNPSSMKRAICIIFFFRLYANNMTPW